MKTIDRFYLRALNQMREKLINRSLKFGLNSQELERLENLTVDLVRGETDIVWLSWKEQKEVEEFVYGNQVKFETRDAVRAH